MSDAGARQPRSRNMSIQVSVTKTMKNPTVVAAQPGRTLVTIVVVDQDGNPLPLNTVKMDGLSFIARDGV